MDLGKDHEACDLVKSEHEWKPTHMNEFVQDKLAHAATHALEIVDLMYYVVKVGQNQRGSATAHSNAAPGCRMRFKV